MPRYSVKVHRLISRTVEVEAADEEEGRSKAHEAVEMTLNDVTDTVENGAFEDDDIETELTQLDGPWVYLHSVSNTFLHWEVGKPTIRCCWFQFNRGPGRYFTADQIDVLKRRVEGLGFEVISYAPTHAPGVTIWFSIVCHDAIGPLLTQEQKSDLTADIPAKES